MEETGAAPRDSELSIQGAEEQKVAPADASCCCKVFGKPFRYRSLSSLIKHAQVHADGARPAAGQARPAGAPADAQSGSTCARCAGGASSGTASCCSTRSATPPAASAGGSSPAGRRWYRTKQHTDGEPNYCRQSCRRFKDTLRKHLKKTKRFPLVSSDT